MLKAKVYKVNEFTAKLLSSKFIQTRSQKIAQEYIKKKEN